MNSPSAANNSLKRNPLLIKPAVQKYGSKTRKKLKRLVLGESVPSQSKWLHEGNIYYIYDVSNYNVLHKPHQDVSLSEISNSLGQI